MGVRRRRGRHGQGSPELERQATEAGAFAYLDKGTMARRVHRVLLAAAVHAVLAANTGQRG